MKKTKILSLAFAFMFAFSAFAGCGEKNSGASTDETVTYEASGYKLVEQGTSEYVILLPESPTENEYMAANELTYFMKAATKAELTVTHESEYSVSDKKGREISPCPFLMPIDKANTS